MVPATSPQHVWIQGYWAWNGKGVMAIRSFPPVRMPNGFLVIGGVSQVAGFGFLRSLEEILLLRVP